MRTPRTLAPLAALLALLLVSVLAPGAAMACSCVPPDMILDTLGDSEEEAVFTGTVGPAVGDRVPVQVHAWYGEPAPAAVVTLEVMGGGDASCGTVAPPAGRQFLFVSYETGTGTFGLNLCSVAADLATPDGIAILDQVVATLGPPAVVDPPPEPTPEPSPTSVGGTTERTGIALPIGGAVLLTILVVGGVVALAGRRRRT
jgi:hypothetical protein